MHELVDVLAEPKSSGWKFQHSNLSPHDGALGNESNAAVPFGDDALVVVSAHSKL